MFSRDDKKSVQVDICYPNWEIIAKLIYTKSAYEYIVMEWHEGEEIDGIKKWLNEVK